MSGSHTDKERKRIAIVGAGLAGAMAAALLAKLDFDITIFEKRPDHHAVPKPSNTSSSAATSATSSVHGNATNSLKRSINLALSYRGICALKELDDSILSQVLSDAVPMPGRVIHSRDGSQLFQRYGQPGQQLYSVSRFNLNEALLEHLRRYRNVRVYFSSQVQVIEHMTGRISVRHYGDESDEVAYEQKDYCFDLIIGADGAYSKVRESLLSSQRVNFSRSYVRHGYKELNIPPSVDVEGNLQYALQPHEGLHIWPRGDFMMIALPNPDKSFTATLFAPFAGENGFDQHAQGGSGAEGDAAILRYFQTHFPDVLVHMPTLTRDFRTNPVGSLVTMRVDPWAAGRTLLIGDAAHAVVPFYGQGMNAAFQDALMLYQQIQLRLAGAHCSCPPRSPLPNPYSFPVLTLGGSDVSNVDLVQASRTFAALRQPAAYALADLCLEHYHDMARNTQSLTYHLYKHAEQLAQRIVPWAFTPLYSLIAFSDTPYHLAQQQAQKQETAVSLACLGLGLGLLAGAVGGAAFLYHKK